MTRNKTSYLWCFRIAIAKLDVLDDFDEVKLGVAYRHNGKKLTSYPGAYCDCGELQFRLKSMKLRKFKIKICYIRGIFGLLISWVLTSLTVTFCIKI